MQRYLAKITSQHNCNTTNIKIHTVVTACMTQSRDKQSFCKHSIVRLILNNHKQMAIHQHNRETNTKTIK